MAHNQIQQIKFINKNKFLNFRQNECNELNKNLFICYYSYLINQKFIKNLLSNIIDVINNNNNSSGSNSNNYNENQNECKSFNGAKHNYYSNFLLDDDEIDFIKSEYKYYKCNNCIMKKKDKCAIMMLNNNNYQSNYTKLLLNDKNNSHSKQQSTKINKKIFIYNQYKNLNNKSNINLSSKLMNLLVLFILYISFISINLDTVNASSSSASSKRTDNFYSHHHHHHLLQNEFSSHTIIRPQVHHGRYKRSITSTLEEGGLHAQHITFSFHHDGQKIVTDLYLNEDLIPHGHFLRYQNDTKNNGEKIIKNFTNKTDLDLCHYQGTIRGNPDTIVALSTCDGINGVIFDGHSTYFIYSGENGRISDDHYLFRHDNIIKNATCGFSNNGGLSEIHNNNIHDDNNNDIYNNRKNVDNDTDDIIPSSSMEINDIHNRILRYKRSIIDNTIRGPYNANKHSSFVELVIVVDNKVYKSFGENLKKVHHHCKDIANIVNALYVPLNIFIALVGVVVWNEANEIELSNDGDITLKNFLHYRRKILAQDHPNDNAQLLTKEQFNGGVVGKALKGPMCTYEYSGGVSMEHSQIVGVVATTVAHEMGHNFGMEHDTSECKCREEKCIMSASSTSIVPRYWSSCSVDQLNVAFSRGMNYCLRNKPTKLFDSPQCGNGFVEPGEQCDCGLPKYCENTCCNSTSCMLYANASCATGECCDLKTCHPKTAGTECRSAEGECDLPEYCTGQSEYCPTDVYKRDTESCDNGNAFCFQGSCRSRSNQCKILWGPSGESSEHCYKKNIDGTRHGNCGYNRIAQKYMECDRDDVFCGMLHCRHLNERLEFGMESAAVLSHSFMNHEGSIIPCRTAIVDLGLQSTDPGLTPNGAKCGEGKMCVNQKCVKVDKLRAEGRGVECPENCNGQGICNSKGHCHCRVGFAPPFCNNPGSGGSEDSGPATNPNSHIGFTRAMYIFFLGVVPTVSIFLFLTYYWKQNRPLTSSTRKSATVLKTTMKPSAPSRGSSSPPGGMPTSSPSSTDDMNSALLRSPTESDTSLMNNSMFGKFKGFTLRPLPNATGATHIGAPNVAFVHPVTKSSDENNSSMTGAPLRVAPPPPKPPISSITSIPDVVIQTDIKPSVVKQNGTLPNMMKSPSSPSSLLMQNHSSVTATAPALPPPNPGFNARPIISSPILEASTCTAKELMSPLKNSSGNSIPIRPAPTAPPIPPHADFNLKLNQTSNSSGSVNNNERGFKDGTIKRIASFLRKDDNSSSQKHPQKVKPVIDREKLKNIEISAPIPVVDSSYDTENLKNHQTVGRTQSMRDNGTKKPIIQSFGSMRQSGTNRPKSMVGSRPKSPPPRPPAPPVLTNLKTSEVSSYQIPLESKKSATSQNEYDDCEAVEIPLAHISEENSPTGSDNIYSVIDECAPTVDSIDPSMQNITGSNDSMGLLGEIVSEIEKRNVDSIYSASTLKRKKSLDNSTSYSNTSESNDYSEGDYVKSNGSTTSSGYVRPSAINAPVARVAPTRPDQPPTTAVSSNLNANITGTSSSFSSFKPKPSMPLTAAGNITKTANTNSKPETKTISINKPITSVLNHSKVTTPTSAKVANSSDSMRKRSPSPIAQKLASTVNRHRPTTAANNSVPGIIRKNSIGESKTITDTKRSSNVTNSNQSQKPKPLSKPALVGSKPITRAINNSETSKFNRQNSDTTKPSLSTLNKRTQSSTDQQQSSSALNRKMSGPKSATTNSKSDDNSTNNSSNVSSNSNNKNVIAVSRPLASGGKLSNVASLQQKFENVATSQNTTTTTPGNSSKINSSITAKK